MGNLSVEELGNRERRLFTRMPKDGFVEDRDAYLKEHRLYQDWNDIYICYAKLAQAENLEALKRGLFFAWFSVSEPSWLSGIPELPNDETSIIAQLLECHLAEEEADEELKFMLPYYMSITDYYLERFYPLPNFVKASGIQIHDVDSRAARSRWELRGQMGEYWAEA